MSNKEPLEGAINSYITEVHDGWVSCMREAKERACEAQKNHVERLEKALREHLDDENIVVRLEWAYEDSSAADGIFCEFEIRRKLDERFLMWFKDTCDMSFEGIKQNQHFINLRKKTLKLRDT